MSLPSEILPVGLLGTGAAGAGGYEIERSVRFNSADSAYLSRTPASAGNRKTWTWAGWVKRNKVDDTQGIFEAYTSAPSFFLGFRTTTDDLAIAATAGISPSWGTAAKFRDPSAWYHIVAVVDTTSATSTISSGSTDRMRLYVNGVQQVLSGGTVPSQNADLQANSTIVHHIGRFQMGGFYSNLLLADIHFIDGQALDPTSFGEFDANGIWQPIAYSGTYGTNGFHLPFSDNSTAAALGTDTSGNSNTWTVNNISVAAGAGNDSLVDFPTNGTQEDTGVGGEVVGNYATLNPLANSGLTLSNGNLDFTSNVSNRDTCISTIAVSSGKWYWELTVDDGSSDSIGVGIEPAEYYPAADSRTGSESTGYAWWLDRQQRWHNGSSSSYGDPVYSNAVIGVALDLDGGSLTFYLNGSTQGVAYTGISGTYLPSVCDCANVSASAGSMNFGQRPFAYTAPSGFKSLNTANLPTPTILKGSDYFDTKLYTGNGSTQTISGLDFSPDLVWIKGRSGATDHALYNIVRGATKDLVSNSTAAETTQSTGLTAFNSDGFALGALAKLNTSSATYAAWCWDAGTSTVTNTAGSITSTVRANASAGFSIVTYTGTGSSATVGHGLGVAPSFIIVKNRTTVFDWAVYHSSLGGTKYLDLNTTDAAATASGRWNNTDPTSTVFSVNNSSATAGIDDYVAYCFAPVDGYSSFGSYTGNGSADGPFVYTGHRPRWILLKRTNTTSNWTIIDTSREGYNVDNDPLYPNLSNAEGTTDLADILSNGFKLRSTDASVNASGASGGTYIYASISENPFSISRAR